MLRLRVIPPERRVEIDLEGRPIAAFEGEPLAASLCAAGQGILSRSLKYHRPRGPFCFSASCAQCLMRVDGVPNVFSCQVPARAGLRVERQNAFPSAGLDVLEAVDWIFPRRLDHHHLMAGVPVADAVTARVTRRMAGLGRLPDRVATPADAAGSLRTEVAIVGGGVAGFAAARELRRWGVDFALFDRDPFSALPEDLPEVRAGAAAVGLYDEAQGRFLAVAVRDVRGKTCLLRTFARRFLLATGGHATLPPFANNDRPGIYSGRAAGVLLERHGLLVGGRVVLAEAGDSADPLEALLRARGALVTRVHPGALGEAYGRRGVRGVYLRDGRTLTCDALVINLPPSPSFELAAQGGARVQPGAEPGTFSLVHDADGRTAASDLFVAGALAGALTHQAAEASGITAARALGAELRR